MRNEGAAAASGSFQYLLFVVGVAAVGQYDYQCDCHCYHPPCLMMRLYYFQKRGHLSSLLCMEEGVNSRGQQGLTDSKPLLEREK